MRLFNKKRSESIWKNRLGKYFLYALGEIVLVVIGILIALQINEWNSEKKATDRAEMLLRETLNETAYNLRQIKDVLEELDMKLYWLLKYTKELDGKELVNHDHINEMVLSSNQFFPETSDYSNFVSEAGNLPQNFHQVLSYLQHLNNSRLEVYRTSHSNVINLVEQNKTFMQLNLKYYGNQNFYAKREGVLNEGYSDFETIEFQYRNMIERYMRDAIYNYRSAIKGYGIEATQCYMDVAEILDIPEEKFPDIVKEYNKKWKHDRTKLDKTDIE